MTQEHRCAELLQLLRTHPDPEMRSEAALELARFSGKEVVAGLAERLEQEEEKLVRESIVSALIVIGDEEVVAQCVRLLRSRDAYVRNAAVEILGVLNEKSFLAVSDLARDPDPDVRLLAVHVLGTLYLEEAAGVLRRVVAEDPDVNVVAAAVEYLGEVGSGAEDAAVIAGARARFSDPFLHFAVAEALEKLQGGTEKEAWK